jgi:hypothetical protein
MNSERLPQAAVEKWRQKERALNQFMLWLSALVAVELRWNSVLSPVAGATQGDVW